MSTLIYRKGSPIYIHIHAYTHAYIYTYIHMCTLMYIHMYTYIHTYTHIHIYIYIYIYIYIRLFICAFIKYQQGYPALPGHLEEVIWPINIMINKYYGRLPTAKQVQIFYSPLVVSPGIVVEVSSCANFLTLTAYSVSSSTV